jgi:hypothetical protein
MAVAVARNRKARRLALEFLRRVIEKNESMLI